MVYFMCPEQNEVTVSSTLTLGLLNTYSTVKKLGKAADVPYMSVWGALYAVDVDVDVFLELCWAKVHVMS